jgi:hypothetical protein
MSAFSAGTGRRGPEPRLQFDSAAQNCRADVRLVHPCTGSLSPTSTCTKPPTLTSPSTHRGRAGRQGLCAWHHPRRFTWWTTEQLSTRVSASYSFRRPRWPRVTHTSRPMSGIPSPPMVSPGDPLRVAVPGSCASSTSPLHHHHRAIPGFPRHARTVRGCAVAAACAGGYLY